ncbi:hypothetical protein [Streptomyces sp. NPDC048142]|uniref:hypothetical protein n=1 Tax=Streptomyces sp. NPDC048142 TaxID=3365501 RepID=UPI0037157BD3
MAANTVTVGDVTTAGHKVGRLGKGQTPHFLTDASETACTGKPTTPADDFNAEINLCKTCAKLFTAATAATTTTEESDTVAETETDTKPKTDAETLAEVTKDVENLIDVLSTLAKGDADKITSTQAQANAELLKISAAKRAPLSMRLKEAVAAAKGRTTTAVVKPETTTVEEIPGYAEIIDNTSDKMAEGIRAEVSSQETARVLAEAILDARLRVADKKGRPDLKGTRQASRDLAGRIKDAAAEKLIKSGYKNDKADFDDLMESLQEKISYQMTAVLPQFVRTLDDSPEQAAELFPALVGEATEERPLSAILFDEYKIDPESRAERAARKRAETKAAKELAERRAAGELTDGSENDGEGEGEGNGGGTDEKSAFDKASAKLDKAAKDVVSVVANAEEYSDEEREKLRKQITDALSKFGDALSKLS